MILYIDFYNNNQNTLKWSTILNFKIYFFDKILIVSHK